jgi:hypothetical protein
MDVLVWAMSRLFYPLKSDVIELVSGDEGMERISPV